ncbi:MAG TPA: hypothetical protein VGX48_12270 [Pyrinomonadaceae bacterium]|nr:hypothetical protein [Pyrinomonadaceae bacterium]
MAKRKRYCRGCGERIHRSSWRCGRCRTISPPWTYLAAASALAAFLLYFYSC